MAERVLVCGGRDFCDREGLFHTLDALASSEGVSVIIQGATRGADSLAAEWALLRGVPSEAYAADWATLGNSAGPVRNQQMLEMGKPTRVLAFPGGRGTADMIRRARLGGVTVVELPYDTTAEAAPLDPSYYVYVDEAGTSAQEPITVVASVTIPVASRHAIDAEMNRLFNQFVPPGLRQGFIFHATELYHGKTSREAWHGNSRWQLLQAVISIPKRFHLPIALGTARRSAFLGRRPRSMTAESFDHSTAFHLCIAAADMCLVKYAEPDHVAVLVVEDLPEMRRALWLMHDMAKRNPVFLSPDMIRQDVTDLSAEMVNGAYIRATRIVDQPDFAKKAEEPLLQLADACAFTLRRWLSRLRRGEELMEALLNGSLNIDDYSGPGSFKYLLPWFRHGSGSSNAIESPNG